MINDIQTLWDQYGFEVILVICVFFLIIVSIYHYTNGISGTWDNNYIYVRLPNLKYRKKIVKSARPAPELNVSPNTAKDSRGELECRNSLENLFKKSFNKIRPGFLKNPVTGNEYKLELDCYNAELQLAVEYNGVQHYKYIPFFHKNKEAFLNQRYRDYMKRQICKENKIILIEVPYTVDIGLIRGYLMKELGKNGYKFS